MRKRRMGESAVVWGRSGDTTPCRMTAVALHGVVSPEVGDERTVRTEVQRVMDLQRGPAIF